MTGTGDTQAPAIPRRWVIVAKLAAILAFATAVAVAVPTVASSGTQRHLSCVDHGSLALPAPAADVRACITGITQVPRSPGDQAVITS